MTFFEDAYSTAKDVTGSVIKKTSKVVDISKLRLSASEISKEITRRYEALGRLMYDSRKSGTDIDGLISECVKSIDALYGRLDDVNARIAKLKDKKYCNTCGATVERSAIYCGRCGCRIEPRADHIKPNGVSPEPQQPNTEPDAQ